LDYLFEMSDGENATLKENLVMAGKMEPANAGFFMVAPKEGDLEQINSIIQEQEVKAKSLPYPYFDPVEGWGHVIQPDDQWEALKKQGRNWTFWSAFSDQGLLYYWTKVRRLYRVEVLYLKGRPRRDLLCCYCYCNAVADALTRFCLFFYYCSTSRRVYP
jgi:hypothetical protein